MNEKHGAKYIARSSAIASRMLGGEMMIMSAADSTFFTLNPVASVIWQAADGRTPLSEIVASSGLRRVRDRSGDGVPRC